MTTFLIILFLALIITCVVLWYLLNESNDEVKSLTHQLNNAWGQEQTTRDDARKACEDALAAYAEMERRQANLRRFLQSLRDRLKHNLLQREGPKSIGSIVDDEFDEWWDRWGNDGGR